MEFLYLAIIAIVTSIVLILIGVPIAYAIGACTVGAILIGIGSGPLARLGILPYSSFFSMSWIPLPLFMLMACIIGETAIGEDIFNAANKWLSFVPGGLLVASVAGEALMAATMGSSGTTLLTVGTIVDPEVRRLKYNREFSMSALLAGGVLGPLIPPSTNFIIYANSAQCSVSQLFMAGIVPGIMLTLMIAGYIIISCLRHPEYAPTPIKTTWKERFSSLRKTWAVLLLMIAIIGGIFTGAVTATEAGAVGVVVTLIIAVSAYGFRFKNLVSAMGKAATLSGMVFLMVLSVNCFTYVVAVSGLSDALSSFVRGLHVAPVLIVFVINIIFLILGCVMDGLAILMITTPLFVPIITALGYSPIWFGVLACVNMEIGLITPPVGLNLFMATGTFKTDAMKLIKAVIPFIILLMIFLALLILFPQISMWLPSISNATA